MRISFDSVVQTNPEPCFYIVRYYNKSTLVKEVKVSNHEIISEMINFNGKYRKKTSYNYESNTKNRHFYFNGSGKLLKTNCKSIYR